MGPHSGSQWNLFSDIVAGLKEKPAYLLIFAICALVFFVGLASGIDAAVEKKPDRLYFAFGSFAVGLFAAVIVIFRVESANGPSRSHPRIEKSTAETSIDFVQDLGNFPAFLPAIIKNIKNAPDGSTIQIACDYVSYGMFSAGRLADDYRDALRKAATRGCIIEMLVLGSEPWKQMLVQVPREYESAFEELTRKEEFRKILDEFNERMTTLGLPVPKTWTRAKQLEALVQVEHHCEKLLRASGVQITIVRGPLPLYLWLTNSSAVWVLCPLEPRMRFPLMWHDLLTSNEISSTNPLDEHGFLSHDDTITQRLRHVWRQYNAVELRAAAMSQSGKS
jgi:hypothetical protein